MDRDFRINVGLLDTMIHDPVTEKHYPQIKLNFSLHGNIEFGRTEKLKADLRLATEEFILRIKDLEERGALDATETLNRILKTAAGEDD